MFLSPSCHILPHVNVYFTQESPLKDGWGSRITTGIILPKISLDEAEAIKNALLSHGPIPDGDPIDKKTCLLAIYHYLINMLMVSSSSNTLHGGTIYPIFSPMRRTRAARLTFNCEYHFTWQGWHLKTDRLDVEKSHVTIENNSWTQYV